VAEPNRFSATKQPDHKARGEKQSAMAMVRHAARNALDKLGNEAFFLELARGHPIYEQLPVALKAKLLAEDRRCLANIFARLIPVEVTGQVDAALTVRVFTMLGHEVERRLPQDAAPPLALTAAGVDRDPVG
jgi:hypothetical protein